MAVAASPIYSRSQKTFLFIPFIFLPAVVQSLVRGQHNPWSTELTGWILFLVGVVCLNTLHILFTYQMLIFLPELRRFARSESDRLSISFSVELMLVFCISFVFFYWLSTGERADKLYWSAMALISFWHTLRQMAGISSLAWYTEGPVERSVLRENRGVWIRVERWGFLVLYAIFALHTIGSSLVTTPYALSHNQLSWPAAILSLICVLLLQRGALAIHSDVSRWKRIYLCRLFYVPLMYFSLPAAVAITALHGIEYFFIAREMTRRSEQNIRRGGHLFLCITIPLTIGLLLTMPYGSGLSWWIWGTKAYNHSALIAGLAALGGGLTLTHYYLDWRLFRFRDEAQRRFIAPLLRFFVTTPNET